KSRESQEIAVAGSKEKTADYNSLLGLNEYLEPPQANSELENISAAEGAMLHLKYLLEELKQHSFQGEISLLIMRLASEVCSRGVLFLVKEREMVGLGQFGLTSSSSSPDQWVRGISIPIGKPSILDRVATTRKTVISAIDPETYDLEII